MGKDNIFLLRESMKVHSILDFVILDSIYFNPTSIEVMVTSWRKANTNNLIYVFVCYKLVSFCPQFRYRICHITTPSSRSTIPNLYKCIFYPFNKLHISYLHYFLKADLNLIVKIHCTTLLSCLYVHINLIRSFQFVFAY